MPTRKSVLVAAAAAALINSAARAVTISFQFDLNEFEYSGSLQGPYSYSPVTNYGTAANPALIIPYGVYFSIAIDVEVSGSYADPSDGGVPLGIASWQLGLTDSNEAAAQLYPFNASAGTAIPAPLSADGYLATPVFEYRYNGVSDGNGGIPVQNGIYGANLAEPETMAEGGSNLTFGGGTPAEIISGLVGVAGEPGLYFAGGGTSNSLSTFSLTCDKSALEYVALDTPSHGTSPATYQDEATDTVAPLPTLTVLVQYPPSPLNRVISLASSAPSGTPPDGYGSAPICTLNVSSGSPAFFNIGQSVPFGGATTGYIAIAGEPTEVALQLDLNGVPVSPNDTSLLETIIGDMKNSSEGVYWPLITTVTGSPFASEFPGYDILVPVSGTDPYFGFDFSNTISDFADTDTALGAVTVTGIAAVPEPMTALAASMCAVGLLVRRTRRIEQSHTRAFRMGPR